MHASCGVQSATVSRPAGWGGYQHDSIPRFQPQCLQTPNGFHGMFPLLTSTAVDNRRVHRGGSLLRYWAVNSTQRGSHSSFPVSQFRLETGQEKPVRLPLSITRNITLNKGVTYHFPTDLCSLTWPPPVTHRLNNQLSHVISSLMLPQFPVGKWKEESRKKKTDWLRSLDSTLAQYIGL